MWLVKVSNPIEKKYHSKYVSAEKIYERKVKLDICKACVIFEGEHNRITWNLYISANDNSSKDYSFFKNGLRFLQKTVR